MAFKEFFSIFILVFALPTGASVSASEEVPQFSWYTSYLSVPGMSRHSGVIENHSAFKALDALCSFYCADVPGGAVLVEAAVDDFWRSFDAGLPAFCFAQTKAGAKDRDLLLEKLGVAADALAPKLEQELRALRGNESLKVEFGAHVSAFSVLLETAKDSAVDFWYKLNESAPAVLLDAEWVSQIKTCIDGTVLKLALIVSDSGLSYKPDSPCYQAAVLTLIAARVLFAFKTAQKTIDGPQRREAICNVLFSDFAWDIMTKKFYGKILAERTRCIDKAQKAIRMMIASPVAVHTEALPEAASLVPALATQPLHDDVLSLSRAYDCVIFPIIVALGVVRSPEFYKQVRLFFYRRFVGIACPNSGWREWASANIAQRAYECLIAAIVDVCGKDRLIELLAPYHEAIATIVEGVEPLLDGNLSEKGIRGIEDFLKRHGVPLLDDWAALERKYAAVKE